jgi:SAM-dependent methyltransferase
VEKKSLRDSEKIDRTRFKRVINHFDAKDVAYLNCHSIIIPFITKIILSLKKKDTGVLEVGCGGGIFLRELLSHKGFFDSIVGLDISRELLRHASKSAKKANVVRATVDSLPFQERFNFVVAINVLHHLVGRTRDHSLRNAKIAMQEMIEGVGEGGYLILSEGPTTTSAIPSLSIFWISSVISLSGLHLANIGIHDNLIVNFLTSKELLRIVEDTSKKSDLRLTNVYVKKDNSFFGRIIGSRNFIIVLRKVK